MEQVRTTAADGYKGINHPHGFDPHKLTNRPLPTFQPDYITIIRVDSSGAWRFSANHASFGIDDPANNTPEARLAQALRILRKTGPGKKLGSLRPGMPDGEGKIYRHPDHGNDPNSGYDRDDFKDFGFSGQHEIFVYYDNRDVGLVNDNLVSFSPFRAKDQDPDSPPTSDPSPPLPAAPNDSFIVQRVFRRDIPASLGGQLIRIENYNTILENGAFRRRDPAAQSEAVTYSMNFHFILPASKPIPMVLDPDTGNGYGSRP